MSNISHMLYTFTHYATFNKSVHDCAASLHFNAHCVTTHSSLIFVRDFIYMNNEMHDYRVGTRPWLSMFVYQSRNYFLGKVSDVCCICSFLDWRLLGWSSYKVFWFCNYVVVFIRIRKKQTWPSPMTKALIHVTIKPIGNTKNATKSSIT